MRSQPVSPAAVLQALELFGPQARPYNFDDCFDCWGLVRKVFDWLDDGYEVDAELGDAGDEREGRWRRVDGPSDLVPGDLLTSHPHTAEDFHTVFYVGRVGGDDLVYDSSPRGLVPLYDEAGGRVDQRLIYTRYMRATETTDRLRDDGGAYLRLWDDRQQYVNAAFHERLLAGGAGAQRDLIALRRGAGLSPLPFYCVQRLPRDGNGREVYDNRATRHLDYYVPDGAPLPDDAYLEWAERCVAECPDLRPAPPVVTGAPPWISRRHPLTVTWQYQECDGPRHQVTGCRVEVWEETWDLWRRRLLREDHETPLSQFTVPRDIVHPDERFAVVLFARTSAGYSGSSPASFLFRPAAQSPLLDYNAVRPFALSPDGCEPVLPGRSVTLRWRISQPRRNHVQARVDVYEDGAPASGSPLVFSAELAGPKAQSCRCTIPPEAWLRPGHTYRWYVTPVNARGVPAYAPTEAVFVVGEEG